MLDDHTERLLQIVDKGNRYRKVWDDYVKSFFTDRQAILFDNFKSASCHEPDTLMLLKMQLLALNALEEEFKVYFEGAIIASKELEEMQNGSH